MRRVLILIYREISWFLGLGSFWGEIAPASQGLDGTLKNLDSAYAFHEKPRRSSLPLSVFVPDPAALLLLPSWHLVVWVRSRVCYPRLQQAGSRFREGARRRLPPPPPPPSPAIIRHHWLRRHQTPTYRPDWPSSRQAQSWCPRADPAARHRPQVLYPSVLGRMGRRSRLDIIRCDTKHHRPPPPRRGERYASSRELGTLRLLAAQPAAGAILVGFHPLSPRASSLALYDRLPS